MSMWEHLKSWIHRKEAEKFMENDAGDTAVRTSSVITDSNGNEAEVNDRGQLKVVLDGRVDVNNTTTTPLVGDGIYTGTSTETLDYALIFLTVYSDVASATDGICIQTSTDNVTWRDGDCYTIDAGVQKTFSIQTNTQYYRVRYTNGSTPQTELDIHTVLKKTNSKPSSHRIIDNISDQDDATLQKSVLTSKRPDDVFVNVDEQNPIVVDFDSTYVKDLDFTYSDNYNFTGSFSDYFDSLKSVNIDSTANSPKQIKIWFNRTIYTSEIGLGCDDLNYDFSNVKIELLGSGEIVRKTIDLSADSTKYNSLLIPFEPAAFNGIIINFVTTDTVGLSNITIRKEIKTKSQIVGLKPDGTIVDFKATANGNFKVSLEELENDISVNSNTQLKVTPYDSTGLELGTVTNPTNIQLPSTASDAFGRQRISQAVDLINNKNTYDVNGIIFKEKIVGGSTITYNANESSKSLNTTTASGDRAVRQSPHAPYVPSKSQVIFMTGVIGEDPIANSVRRIGYFDDENGLFFEMDGTTMYVVRRTYVTGSAVDNRVEQSSWNVDAMDGNGPSGITIDWSKTQIFEIDFQWLGVGRVRFALNVDGITYILHEIYNANNLAEVYMSNPTLPIRYEILNTGTTASSSTLTEICSSVSTEGAFGVEGRGYAQESGLITADTTKTPLMAIRLKNSFTSKKNWFDCLLESLEFFAASETTFFYIEKVINPTITATWTSVNTYSAVEYAVDSAITSVSGTSQQIGVSVVPADSLGNNLQSATTNDILSSLNENRSIHQNIDSDNSDLFVVYAETVTGSSLVNITMKWIEVI